MTYHNREINNRYFDLWITAIALLWDDLKHLTLEPQRRANNATMYDGISAYETLFKAAMIQPAIRRRLNPWMIYYHAAIMKLHAYEQDKFRRKSENTRRRIKNNGSESVQNAA